MAKRRAKHAPKFPLYWVRWDDAACNHTTVGASEFDRHYVVDTIGHLVDDREGRISLAQDVLPLFEEDREQKFRDVTHIPKGMILAKKRLRHG